MSSAGLPSQTSRSTEESSRSCPPLSVVSATSGKTQNTVQYHDISSDNKASSQPARDPNMEEDGNSGSGSLGSSETAINMDDNLGLVDREAAPNSNFSHGNGHTSCEPDIDGLGKEKGGTQEEIRVPASRQSSPDLDVPEVTPAVDNGMRDSSNEVEAGHGVDTDIANTSLPLAQEYDFIWGSKDGNSFSQLITRAYAEVAHWRRNLFTVPTGNIGKEFVRETTRLLDAFNQKSRLEPIAVYAS